MTGNAFTQKPDLSKFVREAKHSAAASKNGQQNAKTPTPDQKVLFGPIRARKGKA